MSDMVLADCLHLKIWEPEFGGGLKTDADDWLSVLAAKRLAMAVTRPINFCPEKDVLEAALLRLANVRGTIRPNDQNRAFAWVQKDKAGYSGIFAGKEIIFRFNHQTQSRCLAVNGLTLCVGHAKRCLEAMTTGVAYNCRWDR